MSLVRVVAAHFCSSPPSLLSVDSNFSASIASSLNSSMIHLSYDRFIFRDVWFRFDRPFGEPLETLAQIVPEAAWKMNNLWTISDEFQP